MSSTLHDYTDVEPLVVREIKRVLVPRRGEVLGYIGPCNRDANAIVVQRRRHPYKKDGKKKQQFYRKLGGYTFAQHDIDQIQKSGANYIIIEEIDNNRVLEFELSQYINGDYGGNVGGDDQYGIPVSEAIYDWSISEATLIRDH